VPLAFLAVAAGLVSFASPCCLPLVPGYLSYVSAVPVGELSGKAARWAVVRAALLFVAGFTIVFTALGATASVVGATLLANQTLLNRILGVAVIALGLATLGVLRIPQLHRDRRLDLARIPRGPAWAVPLGMAFAAGWTPCIGPTLGTILTLAAAGGSLTTGVGLLVLYSIGLGLPFVLLAVGYARLTSAVAFLRRHGQAVERLGGAVLVGVGLLLVSGVWEELFRPLQRNMVDWGWPTL
jgi:cytochrome c-type biogenesis protein